MENINIDQLMDTMVCPRSRVLWTFGYASLIWKPGFSYSRRIVGYIKGFKRRFYQGTTTHRGTVDWPGRVATIVSDDDSVVWGVAYEVRDEKEIVDALKHLAEREMINGGYHFDKVTFYPHKSDLQPFEMPVYVADEENFQYLGDGGSLEVQAYQICKAVGVCGRNTEYVHKVADFMRMEVSADRWQLCDKYLFDLVHLISAYDTGDLDPVDNVLAVVPMRVKVAKEDTEYATLKRRTSA